MKNRNSIDRAISSALESNERENTIEELPLQSDKPIEKLEHNETHESLNSSRETAELCDGIDDREPSNDLIDASENTLFKINYESDIGGDRNRLHDESKIGRGRNRRHNESEWLFQMMIDFRM